MPSDKQEKLDNLDDKSISDSVLEIEESDSESDILKSNSNWHGIIVGIPIFILTGIKGFKLWDFELGELTLALVICCYTFLAVPINAVNLVTRFMSKWK